MMQRRSFTSYQQGTRLKREPKGAADFLRGHDKMGMLLPTVTRLVALQKECTAILPAMFDSCAVLHFTDGQLTLSTPNAAIATKLKQQLPNVQEKLLKLGWQVNAIRLKVQVSKILEKVILAKQISLSRVAVTSLADLGESLEDSPRNGALKAALKLMVARHARQTAVADDPSVAESN